MATQDHTVINIVCVCLPDVCVCAAAPEHPAEKLYRQFHDLSTCIAGVRTLSTPAAAVVELECVFRLITPIIGNTPRITHVYDMQATRDTLDQMYQHCLNVSTDYRAMISNPHMLTLQLFNREIDILAQLTAILLAHITGPPASV